MSDVPPIRADGMMLREGANWIQVIGDIHWHADVQQWRCLADCGGALCLIAVKVKSESAQETRDE